MRAALKLQFLKLENPVSVFFERKIRGWNTRVHVHNLH